MSADTLYSLLATLGLITVVALAIVGTVVVLRSLRRLAGDEYAGLYGRYYGYRAPLNPDPLLPLPVAVEVHIFKARFGRNPRAIWQNTSLETHGVVSGKVFRRGEGVTIVLDDGANLPFVVVLHDLTSVGVADIKIGLQSGLLQSHGYPYAAALLLSRRPLDQRVVGEALTRIGTIGVTRDAARGAVADVLAGTPPALTVMVGALATGKHPSRSS